MSGLRVVDGGPRPPSQVAPLKIIEPVAWHGQPIPPRRWVVDGLIPRGVVTLLGGDGGLGKSLLAQQLLTAAAIGGRWLGRPVPHMRGLGFFCEDDHDELQRRQTDICRHLDCELADLEDLRLVTRVGEENALVEFDRRTDAGSRTPLFDQLSTLIRETGIQLIVIDTAADTFAGNENIRTQVRAFVNALRGWAMSSDGAVIITAHPSVLGLNSGSGISGSTAWNNTVRSRLYLTKPKEGEGDDSNGERILKSMKANYGKSGGQMRLRWEEGVFVRADPEPAEAGQGTLFERVLTEERLLKGLRYLIENGARVPADHRAPNGFANAVRSLPACKDLSWAAVRSAQDRMIDSGKLVRVGLGPPSKHRVLVRPADMRYPGEEG